MMLQFEADENDGKHERDAIRDDNGTPVAAIPYMSHSNTPTAIGRQSEAGEIVC
jgi:hypothetical protein